MATYIVAYDLHKQGQNYACLIKKLEGYGTHFHMQQSVWIIETEQSAVQVRDHLKPCLDSNDKLFVGRMSAAAWSGFTLEQSRWLNNRSFAA